MSLNIEERDLEECTRCQRKFVVVGYWDEGTQKAREKGVDIDKAKAYNFTARDVHARLIVRDKSEVVQMSHFHTCEGMPSLPPMEQKPEDFETKPFEK